MGTDDNNWSVLGSGVLIQIPRGLKGIAPMPFDMKDIYRVMARTVEVKNVNPKTYGMLICDFNQARVQLNRLIGLVDIELREAKNSLNLAKSVAVLETVEDFLALKKIKSTADAREAAVTTDPEVQEAIRRHDSLTAISEYVKSLREDIDRAYFSAKQISEMTSKDPYQKRLTGEEGNYE